MALAFTYVKSFTEIAEVIFQNIGYIYDSTSTSIREK